MSEFSDKTRSSNLQNMQDQVLLSVGVLLVVESHLMHSPVISKQVC